MHVGGMENWGCITVKRQYVLNNPRFCTLFDLHYEASLVVHEVSHMWFGNLVTMNWWDDIWLNEGFARYMEGFSLSHIQPALSVADSFLFDGFSRAMEFDDDPTKTHAVTAACHNSTEVSTMSLIF
jgi:aminopeptidase N